MQRVWTRVALAGVALLCICRIVEYDTPWYVAAGNLVASTRSLPRADPFAYTSTRPWLNHEWLSELVLAGGHALGGFAALSVLCAGAVAVTLVLVGRRASGSGIVPLAALAFVLREAASPRAQLFSLVLFAATLSLVLDADDSPRLWLCVPLQLVWTQLHGGDPVGVALLGVLFVSGPSRRRGAVLMLCALATCAGPYGISVHAHFLGARTMLPSIREWEPMWHALAAFAPAQWIAVLLLGSAAVATMIRPSRRDALLLALFTLVAVRYVRFASEASIVASALLVRRLGRPHRLALPVAFALFLVLVSLGARELGLGLDPRRFPVGAVDFLRAHPEPGPLLNSYNFGGYLLYAYPEAKVFVDGRAFTVYDESIIGALLELYEDPARFAALDARWHFHLAVLQRSGRGARFAAWLADQPGWRPLYSDDVAIVLVR